jgi:hypothetical protein
MSYIIVDLPAPEDPIKAVVLPGSNTAEKLSSTI